MSDVIGAPLPRVVFVTGTDTGVGKTVVCAALTATLTAARRSVAVYKPTQAGLDHDGGDIDRIRRLAAIDDVHEGIRLPYPMAPIAAAERAGTTLPSADAHVTAIRRLAARHDHTLVEGAGGLLVQLDQQGRTLADIATATASACDPDRVGAIVVCRAALGTLNHTELTVEALSRRGIAVVGLVIGFWPRNPTEIDLSNRDYLSCHPVPLLAALPEHAGHLPPAQFRAAAPGWFQLTSHAVSGETATPQQAAT
jgi:dethiobiotin synthetase